MINIDPHKTWIYYQLMVTIGTWVIAIANVVSAYYIMKFFKKSIGLIRTIERNTRVVKTDVLLKRVQNAKSNAEAKKILDSLKSGEINND